MMPPRLEMTTFNPSSSSVSVSCWRSNHSVCTHHSCWDISYLRTVPKPLQSFRIQYICQSFKGYMCPKTSTQQLSCEHLICKWQLRSSILGGSQPRDLPLHRLREGNAEHCERVLREGQTLEAACICNSSSAPCQCHTP